MRHLFLHNWRAYSLEQVINYPDWELGDPTLHIHWKCQCGASKVTKHYGRYETFWDLRDILEGKSNVIFLDR